MRPIARGFTRRAAADIDSGSRVAKTWRRFPPTRPPGWIRPTAVTLTLRARR